LPDLSILIPHYHSANGNRALAATLPHLIKHTTLSYELIVTAHREREFIAWNSMAARAAGEWLVVMSHEVQTPVGRIVADRDRFRFVSE
jgi:hypothetical protein